MTSAYIYDGYTQRGCIAERPGLHPELHYEFRPRIQRERRRFYEDMKMPLVDKDDRINQLLCESLVSWSIPEAISESICERLHPAIRSHLLEVCLGNSAAEQAAVGNSKAGPSSGCSTPESRPEIVSIAELGSTTKTPEPPLPIMESS